MHPLLGRRAKVPGAPVTAHAEKVVELMDGLNDAVASDTLHEWAARLAAELLPSAPDPSRQGHCDTCKERCDYCP